MSAKWAAIFETEPGRVTLRFSSPLSAIGLTPDGARRLAAKLLLLAETADNGVDGTFSAPAEGLEPVPLVPPANDADEPLDPRDPQAMTVADWPEPVA